MHNDDYGDRRRGMGRDMNRDWDNESTGRDWRPMDRSDRDAGGYGRQGDQRGINPRGMTDYDPAREQGATEGWGRDRFAGHMREDEAQDFRRDYGRDYGREGGYGYGGSYGGGYGGGRGQQGGWDNWDQRGRDWGRGQQGERQPVQGWGQAWDQRGDQFRSSGAEPDQRQGYAYGRSGGYPAGYSESGGGAAGYGRQGMDRPVGGYERSYGGGYAGSQVGQSSGNYGSGSYGSGSYGTDSAGGGWSSSGMAGSHRGRGPKGYARSDERVREDVSDRLADDHRIDASDIDVQVSGGEVTLSGTVDSRDAKRRAEDCAEAVSGVTHVQNNLRIAGGQTSGGAMGSAGSMGAGASVSVGGMASGSARAAGSGTDAASASLGSAGSSGAGTADATSGLASGSTSTSRG